MKKRILIVLLLLALVLAACGASRVYTAEARGMTFTVDPGQCTITQGETVYHYEISGDRYTITYPDGAVYTMSWSGPVGTGGGSGAYYDAPRLDGDLLIDILRGHQPRNRDPWQVVLCLLVVCLGVFYAAAPRAAWHLRRGWLYRDAEPSGATLAAARISGVVLIVFGIILFFI